MKKDATGGRPAKKAAAKRPTAKPSGDRASGVQRNRYNPLAKLDQSQMEIRGNGYRKARKSK